MERASDILNQAAAILLERGHTKGSLLDPDGKVCLLGAVAVAKHGFDTVQAVIGQGLEDHSEYYAMSEVDFVSDVVHGIAWSWNDREETTPDMAYGALLEAARIAKESERDEVAS